MRSFAAALVAAVVLSLPVAAHAIAIVGEERRITQNLADQYDPAIAGNLVVYTDTRGSDRDVWYFDLATGEERPVTTAIGDQSLTDVAGGVIVFTDESLSDVVVLDPATGTLTNLTAHVSSNAMDPCTDGRIVAWTENRSGINIDVFAKDLVTGEERLISDSLGRDERCAVNGGTIVWQQCASGACDVRAYDWASGTSRAITSTPTADERFSDISGNRVVFQGLRGPDKDIYVHDLVTGTERQLVLAGDQVNPNVSGDWVAFEDLSTGTYEVMLLHVPSWSVFAITKDIAGDQFLNDIDGNRIVYTDQRDWHLDVYLYEFHVQAALDVSPASYAFGDVSAGTEKTTVVTISNAAIGEPVTLGAITVEPANAPFAIKAGPAAGTVLGGGQTLDVEVAFAPVGAGAAAATLVIATSDPLQPRFEVALSGTGVAIDTPAELVADLLDFLDQSVAAGTLAGSGSGRSASGRLGALRNMVEASEDLIQQGEVARACTQLLDALRRVDGQESPPDFAAGPAAATLAGNIALLRATLGCP